ncbi:hypothetical protein FRB93_000799 [Tulasnella sp. JGI-2019a]|nr:hypothetical protein FRB93_000799 [Tulasnella sp. JGI-2019a]
MGDTAQAMGPSNTPTRVVTTSEVTIADKIAPPNPTPVPTATPYPTSGGASGMSMAGIAAIFAALREHGTRMERENVERETALVQNRTAEAHLQFVEEELERRREEARAVPGESSNSSDVTG